MELKEGTPVYIVKSNSGYIGEGVVIGIAFGNSYLVKINSEDKSIILVQRHNLNPISANQQVEEPSDEEIRKSEKRRKRQKEVEEFLSETMEGRIDDENPKDGCRGRGRNGSGKRLPRRRRR